jgi:hypothetical protein
VDYNVANNYAEQIKQGSGAELHQKLANMCTSYLLYLRKKLGFYCIPVREITHELGADAVSDAIMAQEKRNLPFTICLHNAFRDCCRQRVRIIREQNTNDLMDKCDIAGLPLVVGMGAHAPSAEAKVQNAEQIEFANTILDNHNRFSKRVIYQKIKGSTYPEMADIFNTTLNECKRVYWHDIYHIRKKFGQNYEN